VSRPVYFMGVDHGSADEAAAVMFEWRDGVVHVVSATTDPEEVAELVRAQVDGYRERRWRDLHTRLFGSEDDCS